MAIEVVGAGRHHVVLLAKLFHPQGGVLRDPDADQQVDRLGRRIDIVIRLLQLDLEQGVALQQLGQIGGDVQPAKGDRRADPDGASRGVRPLLDLADYPLILLEDLGALFGKGDPLLGEGDGAGMAV